MPRMPIGNKYSATTTSMTLKPVTCQYCGCQFLYQMTREGKGESTSWLWLNNAGAANSASVSAREKLEYKLINEIDAYSCPDCGMYQENMVKKLKENAWKEAGRVAVVFGIIGGILIWLGTSLLARMPNFIQLTLQLVVIGFWSWAILKMSIRAYRLNPNANFKKRRGRKFSEKYPVQRLDDFNELKKDFIKELYFKKK